MQISLHRPARVVIRGPYGAPQHPAFTANALAEKVWKRASARGLVKNIRRFDLKKLDPDDLERDERRAARAIGLDYHPHFEDRFNRMANWESIVSPDENVFREGRRKELVKRQKEILDKAADKRDDEEKAELPKLEAWLKELALDGPGFMEEVPNGFGDNTSALYDPLNEPYIPKRRRSKFVVEPDTPFCQRLYFFKPNEEQADWEASLGWWYYRLIFRADRVEFVRLNPKLSPAQIAAKEKELQGLLDQGRITREDTLWKAEQKERIAAIKEAAKAAGRSGERLSDSEKVAIKAIEKTIDERWESKRRRTGEQNARIEALQKEVYLERQQVQFEQRFETFFNQALVLTFWPQTRGYITISLEGAASWSFEVREVTKTRKRGSLWGQSKIEVALNGGALKWQTGWPEPGQPGGQTFGAMGLGPLDPGFDVTGVPFDVTGHWDADSALGKEGSVVDFTLEPAPPELTKEMVDHAVAKDGAKTGSRLWLLTGVLTPGAPPRVADKDADKRLVGWRWPWLYDAQLFINAGPRNGGDAVAWDSANHLTAEGESLIKDIKPSWDARGALTCAVTLRNEPSTLHPEGELSSGAQPFPRDLSGLLCDIYIDSISNNDTPFLARGSIRQPKVGPVTSAGAFPLPAPGAEVSFPVADRWAMMDDTMRAQPIGDGQDLGKHVAVVLGCRGEFPSELAEISNATGIKLDGTGLGENPANQPSKNTSYAQYVEQLLDTQGLLSGGPLDVFWTAGNDAWTNGGKWRLEPESATICSVEIESEDARAILPARFSSSASYEGRLFLHDLQDTEDDDSQLWNIFTVEGATDPLTKEPISETFIVFESIGKKGDIRCIGREKVHPTMKIDALRERDAVKRVVSTLAKHRCRSIKFRRGKTAFLKGLRPGKRIEADGVLHELARGAGASLADDEMEWLLLRLE